MQAAARFAELPQDLPCPAGAATAEDTSRSEKSCQQPTISIQRSTKDGSLVKGDRLDRSYVYLHFSGRFMWAGRYLQTASSRQFDKQAGLVDSGGSMKTEIPSASPSPPLSN